jgi:hypothetical protein
VTLPSIGTTAGAQAANIVAAATSTAAGAISFAGISGLQGSTITAVVTIPGAPPTAIFTATLGTPNGQGVILDTWGGDSTAGQFQIGVGQTLVVTGTGLANNTAYTVTYGTVTDVGDVQVVIPDPNTSALTASVFAQGIGTEVFNQTVATSGGAATVSSIPITSNTRTLIISTGGGVFPSLIQVIGNNTTFLYYNQLRT